MSIPAGDYDQPWKEALEEYLPEFLALCFPAIHADIDWSRPYTFLDAELQQVMRQAETGLVRADKLVQVSRRAGGEAWVLVHVEVQSQAEAAFARRMYVYNYRIADRYDRDVASLGVLADERRRWRPSVYRRGLWGCTLTFRFPVVKLADWRERRAALAADDNPFATVVLAHLAAQETRRDVAGRQGAKLGLVRRLYERGYSRERVISLFRFIDWLLALPEAAEREVWGAIRAFEEERQMRYITSVERRAVEEGRQEGRLEEARRAVARVAERRFGAAAAGLPERLAGVQELARLEALLDAAAAGNVDEVLAALEEA